jgi:hypothetical protein
MEFSRCVANDVAQPPASREPSFRSAALEERNDLAHPTMTRMAGCGKLEIRKYSLNLAESSCAGIETRRLAASTRLELHAIAVANAAMTTGVNVLGPNAFRI